MARNRGGNSGAGGISEQNLRIFGHAFLQSLMEKGYMLESDAKQLYKRICALDTDAGYLAFISDIGANISFSGFELRRAKWPGDDQIYLGFVNVVSDESSKRATPFKSKDNRPDVRYTAYFRALLEKIAGHPGQLDGPLSSNGLGFISTKDALNLNFTLAAAPEPDANDGEAGPSTQRQQQVLAGAAAQPFRPSDKDRALKYFVEQGWLAKTPNQETCYSLGPRSFLELGTMLAEMDLEPGPKAALEAAIGV
ncbi:hypothetical protein Ndes2526B_g07748 [Nannochloris sp. 'desiccata']|nr:hypothetical protein NADE_006942 [Chlorella desiccata (nom. nud.)]